MDETTELSKRVVARMEELGISQAEVARRARFNRAFVSDLVRGKKRTLHSSNYSKLAQALLTTPDHLRGHAAHPSDFGTDNQSHDSGPDMEVLRWPDAPIHGIPAFRASGRHDGAAVIAEPAAYHLPPFDRLSTSGVYAIAVSDDTMSPKFEAGDFVYAMSGTDVRSKDFVVVKVRAKSGNRETVVAYIRQLLRITNDEVIVRQLSPNVETSFSKTRYLKLERIILSGEPIGAIL